MDRHQTAARVSWITLVSNLVLTALKAVVGLLTGSLVVLSDAAHSASDAFSTILVLLGLKIAQQPPDEKHPYGHSRAETIVAKIIALMLIAIGLNFAFSALKSIWAKSYHAPGTSALVVSLFSIIAKEVMYQYTYRVGERIQSPALIADAWHHRSDAISSVAALIGVLFARLGYPIFDPLMTIVVAAILIKVGWDMAFSIIDELMDAQEDPEIIEVLKQTILDVEGVYSISNLKVHKYGAEHHVDCTITIKPLLNVIQSHDLSHEVEDQIKEELTSVTHVDIHIEPHFEPLET